MFSMGADQLSTDEFSKIHEEYQRRYAQKRLSFQSIRDDLTKGSILVRIGDTYEFKFKYKYIYYYFVASYIKDRITDSRIREVVSNLAHELYVEDSANILLFLAHLSRDPFIIDELLKSASNFFADVEPARLEGDVEFLKDTDQALLQATYEEQELRAARTAWLTELDRVETEAEARELDEEIPELNLADEYNELAALVSEIGSALRTLQIMGQILKNFPGSLEAPAKAQLTRSCYSLGLRCLASLTRLLRENQALVAKELLWHLRLETPNADAAELKKRARETVFGLTQAVSYAIIKRVSFAIGLPSLMETYTAVRDEAPSNAVELIHTSLHLDQLTQFPKKSVEELAQRFDGQPLATSVLRQLVIGHFHQFPVPFDVKQAVCGNLGISYKRLQATDPRDRVLPKKTDGK
jgi:hypothetical protein